MEKTQNAVLDSHTLEETIGLLRRKAPWVKVMVGGAVLTEDYAKTIGADQYCKDAMASVNYAEHVFSQTCMA